MVNATMKQSGRGDLWEALTTQPWQQNQQTYAVETSFLYIVKIFHSDWFHHKLFGQYLDRNYRWDSETQKTLKRMRTESKERPDGHAILRKGTKTHDKT